MHRLRIIAAACLAGVWTPIWVVGAQAQDFIMHRPAPPPAGVEIIGGRPSVLSNWPATLAVTGSSLGNCTATIIGPRVVLTAAHCVRTGWRGEIRWAGAKVSVRCDRHPRYMGGREFDVALCLTDTALAFPTGQAPERLSASIAPPAQQAPLLLQGYGCRRVGGDGPSGVLWEGDTRVLESAAEARVVTTQGGAAVCFGDSGGAAYERAGDLRRVIIGVNARGDIVAKSWLTNLAHPDITQFVTAWMRRNDAQVCGLTAHLAPCHA